jgi:hypothetical protein
MPHGLYFRLVGGELGSVGDFLGFCGYFLGYLAGILGDSWGWNLRKVFGISELLGSKQQLPVFLAREGV